MMESLKIAKQQLIERWVAAFNEIEKFELNATETKSVKYTQASNYDLAGFKNGKIKPGSKLFDTPPGDNDTFGKYGFNEHGFLTTSETYNRGQLRNIGFFAKSDDLIEFIEFSNERKVPSRIQRIVFKDGKKVLFQSVFSNGSGGFYTDLMDDLTNQITKNFNDGRSAICTIESYDYEENQITLAHGLEILPGIGECLYENKYYYNHNKLTEIKRHSNNGTVSTVYVAPSRKSLTAISDELAAMFCDHLIAVLKKQVFDSPLFSVELSYRYCGSYFPNPVVITERQKNEAISQKNENLFIEGDFIYATEGVTDDLEKLYTEFYQLITSKDNWDAGRKMLVTAAKLMMASKLKNELPVTEDFIAFPIEWELEGDVFDKILLKCGVPRANIRKLKNHGWVW